MIQQMYIMIFNTTESQNSFYLKFRLLAIVKKNQTAQRNGEQ